MQIKVLNVGEPQFTKTARGGYSELTVLYEADGKQQNKKLMSFTNEDVYNAMKRAAANSIWEIKLEKDGKYWNWIGAEQVEGVAEAKPTGRSGGNWETAEERARRQVLIVRQSSLSAAIDYHKDTPEKDLGTIIDTARDFEEWVMRDEEQG